MSLVLLRPSSGSRNGGRATPAASRSSRLLHPAAPPSVLRADDRVGVATSLAADLRWDELLWGLKSAPSGQRLWERVADALTWEAWAIAWPVGARLEPHDHGGSSGALVVALGELVETTVTTGEAGEIRTTSTALQRGSSLSFGPRHIHAVSNGASSPAISVHVYSPRLASMTHFDVVGGRLSPQRTVRYRASL